MSAELATGESKKTSSLALLADPEMVMILFRCLFIFAVLSAPAIFRSFEPHFPSSVYLVAIGVMLYTGGLFVLHRRGLFAQVRRGFSLAVDLVLITLWISLSGPPGWQFFPLYYTEVVAAAMWFGLVGSIGTGLVATCLYMALVVGRSEDPVGLVLLTLTNLMPYTFILALLAGILAASETETKRRAQEQDAILHGFRDEIETARRIQATIHPPPPPEIAGWGIGVRYRPSRPFGGDLVGFLQPEAGLLAFYVADVAGKTFPAVVNLPWVRKTLEWTSSAGSVRETIEKANRLVLPGLRPNSFVSLFYGLLDAHGGRLRYVNAGNVPPLYYRATSGEIEALEPTGPVMGANLHARYQERQVTLEPGDVLLVFTDGVTSAVGAGGEEFEQRGVEEFLLGAADLPADDIADALFNRVLTHSPLEKRDDVTILVIKSEGVLGK